MDFFVKPGSVLRELWGKGDTILIIFAGAAAEFALNKAVDWLYFTGKLPSDPLGRLFSTVSYARSIVFSEKVVAIQAIETISAIHAKVEGKRGKTIPDWAYRDVLFMLIDYSIRSFELLERKLSLEEKQEVFDVFFRVGEAMDISGLPKEYHQWEVMREEHLHQNLEYSRFTRDLFLQYRKNLGFSRYLILIHTQRLVLPQPVKSLLGYSRSSLLFPLIPVFKWSRIVKLDWLLKSIVLPNKYKGEIRKLDIDRIPV